MTPVHGGLLQSRIDTIEAVIKDRKENGKPFTKQAEHVNNHFRPKCRAILTQLASIGDMNGDTLKELEIES